MYCEGLRVVDIISNIDAIDTLRNINIMIMINITMIGVIDTVIVEDTMKSFGSRL